MIAKIDRVFLPIARSYAPFWRSLAIGLLLASGMPVSVHAQLQPVAAEQAGVFHPGSARDELSDPAPIGSPPLRLAAPGITAISGRILAVEGPPLQGVIVRLGSARTESDKDGLFLLPGVIVGEAVMIIDGRHARMLGETEVSDRGIHEARVRTERGLTTALPWVSWLPRIDHNQDIALTVSPQADDVVARTSAVPGLELRIPKGAVLTGIDGEPVTRVGLTPIPTNRPPFPLPRHVKVPVYFTAQPGGAVISSADGKWLGMQVVYPNYERQLPKARARFWRYEPDGGSWAPYGKGTVSADGLRVVPDSDTRIYALSGAMLDSSPAPDEAPPPYLPPPDVPPSPPETESPPRAEAPPPPEPPRPSEDGDPVDLASGLFVLQKTDLSVDDVLPIAVTRTYRPGDYNRRSFGVGMTLPYEIILSSQQKYQEADLIQPDGSAVHFTRIIDPDNPTDNNFTTAHFTTNTPGPFYKSRIDWSQAIDGAGTDGWVLTRRDGFVMVFPDLLRLQNIQDRFGNKITITRSSGTAGNVTQVSSPNGRFIRFSYNGDNLITQAVDNIGRTVTYTYDNLGRMITVTDPNGGVTTYVWDSDNRIQSISDARGITYLINTYDANDRVTNQVTANGAAYQFAYTLTGGKVAETQVTDPRGYIRKTTFNAAGYALTDKRAVGTPQESTWTFTRDPVSNLPLSIIDPLGRNTVRSYDDKGNALSLTRLAGTAGAVTTNYTYTPKFNRIASITDPLGHTTTYQRDALDQVTAIIDPLTHTTSFTYNAQGRALTVTDPLTNTTTYAYSTDGDLASVTDPLGRKTAYFNDAIGRRLRVIDPLAARQNWIHNPIFGIQQAIDANGATITSAYTPIGQMASVADARGGTVAFTYDPSGWLLTRTDAASAVSTVTQRDNLGNLLAVTDRKSQATSYTYDPLNRLVSASYADGSTVDWTWDLGDRLTQLQDSAGGTITRSHDGLDRLLSETTLQGTVTYTYDNAGRRLTMQAGNQVQTSYSYDNADRLTGITQGGSASVFGYDNANRRISATLPGSITASYAWDAASQLTGITYANGATTLGTLTYSYDQAGRVASRGGTLFQSVLPAPVTSATYNLANRLTSRTQAGITVSPSWDANGNLTGDGTRTYNWDARNRLIGIPSVASFIYDALNRRKTATLGATATSFLYDDWDAAQEQQGGTPSADLILGLGMDERLSRGTATFLTDALGSTLGLAVSGALVTTYGYDPYGVVQAGGAASTNPFQFTGRENDDTGLLNYRNRYYHPAWGRFVSEDPIGLAGGINVYRYVDANPVDLTDPLGLEPPGGPGSAPGTQTAMGGKGERGYSGSPYDTDNPYKHMKPHPTDPNKVIYKDPQTGKKVLKPMPPGFPGNKDT